MNTTKLEGQCDGVTLPTLTSRGFDSLHAGYGFEHALAALVTHVSWYRLKPTEFAPFILGIHNYILTWRQKWDSIT